LCPLSRSWILSTFKLSSQKAAQDAKIQEGGRPRRDTTTRHPGYDISQRCRKRIEEVFGWAKASAGLTKFKLSGLDKTIAYSTSSSPPTTSSNCQNCLPTSLLEPARQERLSLKQASAGEKGDDNQGISFCPEAFRSSLLSELSCQATHSVITAMRKTAC